MNIFKHFKPSPPLLFLQLLLRREAEQRLNFLLLTIIEMLRLRGTTTHSAMSMISRRSNPIKHAHARPPPRLHFSLSLYPAALRSWLRWPLTLFVMKCIRICEVVWRGIEPLQPFLGIWSVNTDVPEIQHIIPNWEVWALFLDKRKKIVIKYLILN